MLQLSTTMNDRRMNKFLFDALMFATLPYHTVTVIEATGFLLTFLLLQTHGWILGVLYAVIVNLFIGNVCLQDRVLDHRSRIVHGLTWGIFLSEVLSIRWHIAPYVSPAYSILLFLLAVCTLYLLFLVHRSKAQRASVPDKRDIAARIVSSAPAEGTFEECYESHLEDKEGSGLLMGTDGTISKPKSPTRNKRSDSIMTSKRPKPVRLCSVCCVDKSSASAITHCNYCGACFVGLDGHMTFFG
jgi:hypothetical protein